MKEYSPLLKQYFDIKSKHPDAVLLFRVGDFYESYGKDAQIVAEVLDLPLTNKEDTPDEIKEMAGFPQHTLDRNLTKLVSAGNRLAICDQLDNLDIQKYVNRKHPLRNREINS